MSTIIKTAHVRFTAEVIHNVQIINNLTHDCLLYLGSQSEAKCKPSIFIPIFLLCKSYLQLEHNDLGCTDNCSDLGSGLKSSILDLETVDDREDNDESGDAP